MLNFLIKHNLKITIISILIPVVFQIKTLITPPIIYLYDKIPSLSESYDNILSIRSPFSNKNASNNALGGLFFSTVKYKEKKHNISNINNVKYLAQTLLNIQKNSNDNAYIIKIDKALIELQNIKFDLLEGIIEQKILDSKNDKERAKFVAFQAIITYFKDKYQAIKIYNLALSLNKKSVFILNNLGKLYLELKSYQNAIIVYHQIVSIGKNRRNPLIISSGYTNLAISYLKKGNYDNALKYFHNGLSISKKYGVTAQSSILYHNIAILYEKQNNIQQACVNYRRARILYYKDYQEEIAQKLRQKLKKIDCI